MKKSRLILFKFGFLIAFIYLREYIIIKKKFNQIEKKKLKEKNKKMNKFSLNNSNSCNLKKYSSFLFINSEIRIFFKFEFKCENKFGFLI